MDTQDTALDTAPAMDTAAPTSVVTDLEAAVAWDQTCSSSPRSLHRALPLPAQQDPAHHPAAQAAHEV